MSIKVVDGFIISCHFTCGWELKYHLLKTHLCQGNLSCLHEEVFLKFHSLMLLDSFGILKFFVQFVRRALFANDEI